MYTAVPQRVPNVRLAKVISMQIRRRMAYLQSEMLKCSFQHSADFLWPVDAHIPKPKPPSNYHFASKSLERPHSPSFAFNTPHISKPFVIVGETYNFAVLLSLLVLCMFHRSGLHARIAHGIVTFRTLTPISLQSSIL